MSVVGSIAVDWHLGNLRIRKTHTPEEHLVIERADVDDLLAALANAHAREVGSVTFELGGASLVLDGQPLEVGLNDRSHRLAHAIMYAPDLRTVDRVTVIAEGRRLGGGVLRLHHHEVPRFRTVEDIASYVAGDGTDPQRLALADGIRSGRRGG